MSHSIQDSEAFQSFAKPEFWASRALIGKYFRTRTIPSARFNVILAATLWAVLIIGLLWDAVIGLAVLALFLILCQSITMVSRVWLLSREQRSWEADTVAYSISATEYVETHPARPGESSTLLQAPWAQAVGYTTVGHLALVRFTTFVTVVPITRFNAPATQLEAFLSSLMPHVSVAELRQLPNVGGTPPAQQPLS
ncbi:hypothetical protein G7068_08560 [Leucobacter viscericola]|uniref:Uncharacterized protein n=1 Tax=Leucobacter viscericola TaxID=2714935 RepID=A0A6G7XFB5_9MICO|nr:hypothetical protein [Leucobacter viscericola]QIK63243.1 hypothetical protein G7068_08560 [Leucobacter viscericola]